MRVVAVAILRCDALSQELPVDTVTKVHTRYHTLKQCSFEESSVERRFLNDAWGAVGDIVWSYILVRSESSLLKARDRVLISPTLQTLVLGLMQGVQYPSNMISSHHWSPPYMHLFFVIPALGLLVSEMSASFQRACTAQIIPTAGLSARLVDISHRCACSFA